MKRLNHKNARVIMWALDGVGVVLLLIGTYLSESAMAVFVVLGFLCVCAGMGVVLMFWRCPHCGAMLPSREGGIRYCPHCGEPL